MVKNLDSTVNKINNSKLLIIRMNPKDGFYRCLHQPGEKQGDKKRQAFDFIRSKNTYTLDQIVENPGNHALYYLHEGRERAFILYIKKSCIFQRMLKYLLSGYLS